MADIEKSFLNMQTLVLVLILKVNIKQNLLINLYQIHDDIIRIPSMPVIDPTDSVNLSTFTFHACNWSNRFC